MLSCDAVARNLSAAIRARIEKHPRPHLERRHRDVISSVRPWRGRSSIRSASPCGGMRCWSPATPSWRRSPGARTRWHCWSPSSTCVTSSRSRSSPPISITACGASKAVRIVLFVEDLARRYDVPCASEAASVPPGNVEAEARRLRYAFLERAADQLGATKIATGHTRDDQAETVLLRVLRGAGRRGLGGIRPRRGRIIRPMLGCDRIQVRAFLVERGLAWRRDYSNFDLTLERSRMRHGFLPALAREFNPRLAAALADLADLMREEDALLDRLAAVGARSDALESPVLNAIEPPLARRAIRQWWRRHGSGQRLGRTHVEAVRHLASRASDGGEIAVPGGAVTRARTPLEIPQRCRSRRPARTLAVSARPEPGPGYAREDGAFASRSPPPATPSSPGTPCASSTPTWWARPSSSATGGPETACDRSVSVVTPRSSASSRRGASHVTCETIILWSFATEKCCGCRAADGATADCRVPRRHAATSSDVIRRPNESA